LQIDISFKLFLRLLKLKECFEKGFCLLSAAAKVMAGTSGSLILFTWRVAGATMATARHTVIRFHIHIRTKHKTTPTALYCRAIFFEREIFNYEVACCLLGDHRLGLQWLDRIPSRRLLSPTATDDVDVRDGYVLLG
jgi:hypothetical protein